MSDALSVGTQPSSRLYSADVRLCAMAVRAGTGVEHSDGELSPRGPLNGPIPSCAACPSSTALRRTPGRFAGDGRPARGARVPNSGEVCPQADGAAVLRRAHS